MANWCSNTVAFEGSEKAIEEIQKLFKTMADKEKQEEKGQLPDFISLDDGYFFDLIDNDFDTEIFQYQTRWTPNIEAVEKIAEYYNVDFVQDYEEMGCLVYGQATNINGVLTNIYLENEDFQQYEYDESTECYHFEGEIYYCDLDILEILLERKISNHQS